MVSVLYGVLMIGVIISIKHEYGTLSTKNNINADLYNNMLFLWTSISPIVLNLVEFIWLFNFK